MKAGSKRKHKRGDRVPLFLTVVRDLSLRTGDFLLATFKRFFKDECFQIAASLTFTTLLALVPLVTVLFGILNLFPAFHDLATHISHLLVSQLVPTSGKLVQHYLEQFSQKASRLTVIGALWLLGTAILTLWTIDTALNHIWRASRHRDTVVMFIVYWTLLTLGPLLFGAAFGLTSYIYAQYRALVGVVAGNGWGDWLALHSVAVVLEAVTFALLFVLVPRIRVGFRHALIGGFLTALLFELAKRAFSFYILHFKNYELIYGAFSVVPIFLIWLYISWLIVLLGAEVTACLTLDCHRALIPDEDARRSFRLGIRLIARLSERQKQGQGMSLHALAIKEPVFTQLQVEFMLERLARLKIVHLAGSNWFLTRDLQQLNLYRLYREGGFVLKPEGPGGHGSEALDARLDELFRTAEAGLKPALDRPFSRLLGDLSSSQDSKAE